MERDFWQALPWAGGHNKQHLGLAPITNAQWLVDDKPLHANKLHMLNTQYAEVVAQVPHFEPPDIADWQLPPTLTVSDHRYPDWIANFAAHWAEDVFLLDLEDRCRLLAGCLAAPSGWSLRSKIGHPLGVIHAPVQGLNPRIGAAIQQFFQDMPLQTPFLRANWFTYASDQYFAQTHTTLPENVKDWWLRSEQQVVYRPCKEFLLFTVRIVSVPILALGQHTHTVADLRRALLAMDSDEITHFGGQARWEKLYRFVENICPT